MVTFEVVPCPEAATHAVEVLTCLLLYYA